MTKYLAAFALVAACGGQIDNSAGDSDTDDLSSTTWSMEMLRKNPALLPGVQATDGSVVLGHSRTFVDSGIAGGDRWHVEPGDFLYTSNQLGQFLQLPDPTIFKTDKGTATYSRQPGDLFSDSGKLEWTDVEQGYLGDCYFASSLAAVLFADKGKTLTKNMITPVVQGGKVVAYNVIFFQANGRKVKIETDPDLLHRTSNGSVLYMRAVPSKPGSEEWATSLIEKAYATWQGSYNSIGNGGAASDAVYALSGKRTKEYSTKTTTAINAIEKAGKDGRAQVACTYGDHDGVKYPKGIYSDHCYSVRGVHRVGTKAMVMLRNPWGPDATANDAEPTEPPGDDDAQDGIFEVPADQFGQLWAYVDIVQ